MLPRLVCLALLAAAFAGPAAGDDAARLAVASALNRAIAACWVVPADLPAHVTGVRLRIAFTASGALDGSPSIEGAAAGDPASKAFAASAIRAVVRCAPYGALPDLAPHATWKTVVIHFRRPDL